jgi:hypothetical protein
MKRKDKFFAQKGSAFQKFVMDDMDLSDFKSTSEARRAAKGEMMRVVLTIYSLYYSLYTVLTLLYSSMHMHCILYSRGCKRHIRIDALP